MLSYDWLKILAVIALAVLGIYLLFTMVTPTPALDQTFKVFSYYEIKQGTKFSSLGYSLAEKEVFSYDVIKVGQEALSSSDSQVYTARRAAGEGTVMFVSDVWTYEYETNPDGTTKTDDENNPIIKKDEQGKDVVAEQSSLYTLGANSVVYQEGIYGDFYDTKYFMRLCEEYLAKFYDDFTQEAQTPKEEVVREVFLARNGKDNRYRSKAKKEEGIVDEGKRIEKLQEDYLYVTEAFASGKLSHTSYTITPEEGEPYVVNLGIKMNELRGINQLASYKSNKEGETYVTDELNLMIFNNGIIRNGDLRFETISFLRYLVENYATQAQEE